MAAASWRFSWGRRSGNAPAVGSSWTTAAARAMRRSTSPGVGPDVSSASTWCRAGGLLTDVVPPLRRSPVLGLSPGGAPRFHRAGAAALARRLQDRWRHALRGGRGRPRPHDHPSVRASRRGEPGAVRPPGAGADPWLDTPGALASDPRGVDRDGSLRACASRAGRGCRAPVRRARLRCSLSQPAPKESRWARVRSASSAFARTAITSSWVRSGITRPARPAAPPRPPSESRLPSTPPRPGLEDSWRQRAAGVSPARPRTPRARR